MVKIVAIKFNSTGKAYFFDPGDLENLEVGTQVIVETARGREFAFVSKGVTMVEEDSFPGELKPVIRIATEEDVRQYEINKQKEPFALQKCQKLADERNLDMRVCDVDFTFDGSKVIFYFTADDRVDFRDLVKDLANIFRIRIELRQIGPRDEAKMLGGIGSCGKPLCCAGWLNDFQPVSIKMAKNQNLSLNPSKISGICGRLMCCLNYENDTYTELRKGMPIVGAEIDTAKGKAKVIEVNILESSVRARLFTGEMDENGEPKLDNNITEFNKEELIGVR